MKAITVLILTVLINGCATRGGLAALVLTCGDFESVRPGMTYREVVDAIGDVHATLVASSAAAAVYRWQSGRGTMSVTFVVVDPAAPTTEAVVSTKAQYGLCG